MNFIKKLWIGIRKKLNKVLDRHRNSDEYYLMEYGLDPLVTLGHENIIEESIEKANRTHQYVQTDISQDNGLVIYQYDLEVYLENERKRIESMVITMYENRMLENMFNQSSSEN